MPCDAHSESTVCCVAQTNGKVPGRSYEQTAESANDHFDTSGVRHCASNVRLPVVKPLGGADVERRWVIHPCECRREAIDDALVPPAHASEDQVVVVLERALQMQNPSV